MSLFNLKSKFKPAGDQPEAIKSLYDGYEQGQKHQTLLGVTGSGKTFTMANLIEKLDEPALVLAPNKTLAAQLYAEFKELFPDNAVEYFVSYYDYYQPEAFIPSTNTFIEKDSAINEQIDRMRHSATKSLLERKDVIIISSVSCIYGIGSPETYNELKVDLEVNQSIARDALIWDLLRIQYTRSDVDFHRGTFRVRGDRIDVFPAYEDSKIIRIEFFGDYIEELYWADSLSGKKLKKLPKVTIYPGSHHVTTKARLEIAIESIRDELRERLQLLKHQVRFEEAERLEKRTLFDIEMMEEMGFCSGIENYSRHLTGRNEGQPPPTLIEYFPDSFLTLIDESHITVPQIGGMFRGDRSRKSTLVEHGFRLPSALDNRPLNFEEFEEIVDKVMYVSATPADYEIKKCGGLIAEQIIRPTGLLDPVIIIKPATHQIEQLIPFIQETIKKNERALLTTLTKKSAEDLTGYLRSRGFKVQYLHSDVTTVQRTEILRDLRLGVFDMIVGINLLREGLDLPEVSLVAILDADKEGFLRSERSLIQTIGRAARNANGRVILFADRETKSIQKAVKVTEDRRKLQEAYNTKHGITPKTVIKKINEGLLELYDSEYDPRPEDKAVSLKDQLELIQAKKGGLEKELTRLRKKMKKEASNLDFEKAAQTRDQIKRLEFADLATKS